MKNSHTDKLIYFMMGIGSGFILSGILMLAVILNTKEMYDYKDSNSIEMSLDSTEIDKEKQIDLNTSNEQSTYKSTDQQLSSEIINNEVTTSIINEQITTKEANKKEVIKTNDKQVTAKATNDQVTTKATNEQVTTKIADEQVTTKTADEQVTTKTADEQVTTKTADEQVTTKATDEHMTTEAADEESTTETTHEQVTSKSTNELESIQINNIKSDKSLGANQKIQVAKEVSQEVIKVSIPKNSGAAQICRALQENGIIDNSKRFQEYIIKEGKSTKLRSGDFFFTKDLEYDEVLNILTRKNIK